jgi:hypothetical protein
MFYCTGPRREEEMAHFFGWRVLYQHKSTPESKLAANVISSIQPTQWQEGAEEYRKY